MPGELGVVASDGAATAIGAATGLGDPGVALADAARASFSAGLADELWVGAIVLAVAGLLCLVLVPRAAGRVSASVPTGG